jgi:hypothetical protein
MKQNRLVLTCSMILYISVNCHSQISLSKNGVLNLSLGQSSDNSFTQSGPAKIVGTFPGNDTLKNSYLVNSYIAFTYSLPLHLKISLIGELQKNTLAEKKQNVQQIGVQISKLIAILKHSDAFQSVQDIVVCTEISGRYSNDKINKKEGLQFVLSNSFHMPSVFKGNKKWLNAFVPYKIYPADDNSSADKNKWIQYKHTHNIGIEDIRVEKLTMVNLTFGLELYPFSGLLYEHFKKYGLLQLKWSYVDRIDISNSKTLLYVGPMHTLGANINYKFDKDGDNAISFGYEYVDGGNPMKGLANQSYGQLTLNAKVKFN